MFARVRKRCLLLVGIARLVADGLIADARETLADTAAAPASPR